LLDAAARLSTDALLVIAGLSVYALLASPRRSQPSTPGPSATCLTRAAAPGSVPPPGNWTTYHADPVRSGDLPGIPVGTVHTAWSSPTLVDADVYAEPLLCGNSVFVATENNSVYAVNASTGVVGWRTNLGTPVDGSTLPCGDINPTGITGTPVIDPATRTLYAVAFLPPDRHILFGLDLDTGNITSQANADPPGANPTVEQQRGALALANGFVYIPYGGLAGDCGAYHGWVAGVRTGASAPTVSYQVPTGREGGIWAPSGITVAPDGDLYVATGNGASTGSFDYGESVLELSPSLQLLSYFAPSDWAQLNRGDTDVGSLAPTLLPNGELFQIGKAGVGYLLSGTALGGIGGELYNASVCSGAYGGTAHVGPTVLVPCRNGLVKLTVLPSSFSVAWRTASFDAGPPIVTGSVVWSLDLNSGQLLGFNLTTGQQLDAFPVGHADPFATPSASPVAVVVAAGAHLYSFALT
ncbi:MAG: PQQ-binding-like beta-propeller repeat protein, partial [Thermoplasmata archaeon]|nr:PQQ-binding-like beta-propeller repeat protein [Thermoplasmata archaeon]